MTSGDTTLARALATLSAGLDDVSPQLGHSFDQFESAVRAVVPSYCGLWMTVVNNGIPVTISAPEDGGDDGGVTTEAVTSLAIPLSAISRRTSGELVLFASVAGAFVDLAADLAYETSNELVTFEVDTRLGARVALPVGVKAFSVIHQAVGFLIEAGAVPEQAHVRIAELAVLGGHDLATAAQGIVDGVRN